MPKRVVLQLSSRLYSALSKEADRELLRVEDLIVGILKRSVERKVKKPRVSEPDRFYTMERDIFK